MPQFPSGQYFVSSSGGGTSFTGTPNSFVFTDGSGVLQTLGGWTYLTTGDIANASQVSLTFDADAGSGFNSSFNWYLNIEPTANAPTGVFTVHNISANLDNTANGFNFGTGGQCGQILNVGFNYFGDSSTYGAVAYIQMNSSVGNGTDPVTLQGLSYINGFANIEANVTLEQGLQGYGFQPNVDASAVSGTNFYMNAFYDFAQVGIAVNGYQSVQLSPTVEEINNNSGFTGINVNPTVNNFAGNANANGISVAGTYNNFTAGGFSGITVNPNIPVLGNYGFGIDVQGQSTSGTTDWTGVNVNLGNINTTGSKKGLAIGGGNDLGDYAIQATGHSELYTQFLLQSSLTQQYGHVIGGEIIVPDGTAITGTDVLANNMAFTVDLGNATSSYAGGLVSMTTLGYVGQIVGDGSLTGGINFCLNGYNPIHTGSVDRVNNFAALAIPPSGGGTIDESVLYYADQPFGAVGTDNWGIRVETGNSAIENFMPRLAIGDMASRKVANASVGLEIDSTTKAFLNARMTTTQRNALTALDGMQIYNTDTDQTEFRHNGAWVAGGGGSGLIPTSVSSINSDITLTDKVLYLVDTTAIRTLTLPAPTANLAIIIKDATGDMFTNPISLVPNGAELIDGTAGPYSLNGDYNMFWIFSDGTDYFLN